jgi:hypothetical protein
VTPESVFDEIDEDLLLNHVGELEDLVIGGAAGRGYGNGGIGGVSSLQLGPVFDRFFGTEFLDLVSESRRAGNQQHGSGKKKRRATVTSGEKSQLRRSQVSLVYSGLYSENHRR